MGGLWRAVFVSGGIPGMFSKKKGRRRVATGQSTTPALWVYDCTAVQRGMNM
jgi:hypothetical protein